MAPKPTLPAYTDRGYELLDVLDALAETTAGRLKADAHAQRLLGLTAKAFPKEAVRALGENAVTRHLAVYKATADLYDQAVAAVGQPLVDQALRALIDRAKPARRTARLADNEAPMPATKKYDPAKDAYAMALGADQVKGRGKR